MSSALSSSDPLKKCTKTLKKLIFCSCLMKVMHQILTQNFQSLLVLFLAMFIKLVYAIKESGRPIHILNGLIYNLRPLKLDSWFYIVTHPHLDFIPAIQN